MTHKYKTCTVTVAWGLLSNIIRLIFILLRSVKGFKRHLALLSANLFIVWDNSTFLDMDVHAFVAGLITNFLKFHTMHPDAVTFLQAHIKQKIEQQETLKHAEKQQPVLNTENIPNQGR
ncbi:hypothetical protein XENOCAPTIV_013727 [Xenoophorus captivus]|uniref:Uncharacterized protein n=1 Tax=Xenoophorus captivus TaxID=1517983 RepID=A0ABV0S7M6_9TELE